VALVTCSPFPQVRPDDAAAIAPLSERGIDVVGAVWDDPREDWSAYDLVVVRSTWDYVSRRDEFIAWAESVPRLVNPAAVLRWGTDKAYLRDLARAGVPVVATTWLAPGCAVALPTSGDFVVKPAVGAGGRDTEGYRAGKPIQRRRAHAHVRRLLDAGRTVMVQPYLTSVETAGETALVFLAGEFSHSVRKGPLLTTGGGHRRRSRLAHGWRRGRSRQSIAPITPSSAERAVAEQVLAAVPGGAALSYARVDLVKGADGRPVLLELETAEPVLFLRTDDGAPNRFARAVERALAASG
jgi:glutathione synthase/RimK-type ligase-like ATP-grasp enzyme